MRHDQRGVDAVEAVVGHDERSDAVDAEFGVDWQRADGCRRRRKIEGCALSPDVEPVLQEPSQASGEHGE